MQNKEKGLSVPEVHYDSPEPEKLGVKAFTKNAEVYLAPGEGEETLKHELGHVIQQKKESSRREFLPPLTPPCVPFGTRRFNSKLNMHFSIIIRKTD